MKTAGLILKEAREQKNHSPSEVSKITRIRTEFILYIESDDFSKLPSGATTRGFIKNYAAFLGLNPDYVLAIFRRDFIENEKGQIVPRGVAEPVEKPGFWTPKTTIIAAVSAIFLLFAGYLFSQYLILTGPPKLEISQPSDNLQTSEFTLVVKGVTDPDATISINGQLVALEKAGVFSLRVPLNQGQNTISIKATAKNGKTSEKNLTVNLTPRQE